MDSLDIEGKYKKKLKIQLNYKNLFVERKNIIAQNLSGEIHLNSPNSVSGQILSGEMAAFDRWYVDFGKNYLNFTLKNKPILKAEIFLNNILQSKIEYTKSKRIKFHIFSNSLKRFFKVFVQDAYSDSARFLEYIKLSGKFNASGVYNPKNRGFFGILNLNAENIDIKNISVHSLCLKLPVAYNFKKQSEGFLKIDNISVDKHSFSVDTKIYARNNKLRIAYRGINADNFHINPSIINIDLKNKQLKTTARFDFHDKMFKINGRFKRIVADKDMADFCGVAKINVFDGTVMVKNIRLEDIFRLPVLKTDISFNHISLKSITQDTNFGLMTGFIEGYIKNISLVNFTNPLSFDMLIKTQNVRGESKKITLKAVNSISKIGGGYASIALPFFKTFPYSKIGFYAKLKNGIFYLRGLYKDNNKEYIVKKAFLIGVNVINMNKNSYIPWDDMLDRIKRVKKGG